MRSTKVIGNAGRATALMLGAALAAAACTAQGPGINGKGATPAHVGSTGTPAARAPSASASAPASVPASASASASPDTSPHSPSPQASTSGPTADAPPVHVEAKVLWKRGDTGRDVRELQARLHQAAWLDATPTGTYGNLTEQAVSGFQGKRGLPRTGRTDTVTWQRLLAMTHEPSQWELYPMGGQPADAPDSRCLTGRVLCISKTSRTLRWMVNGRTEATMAVRFGSQYTPTREGVFQVYWKSRHHVSTLYNSPMPYAMFFSGGQAVHYSADFAARGYAGASHGCVNVRDEQAIAALYAQVRTGDKVVVYR